MASDDESNKTMAKANNANASASARIPKEPTGNVVEQTFMMGTTLNLGSPINSGASVASSIASRATVNATKDRGEAELTKDQMKSFADIIALSFVEANKRNASPYASAGATKPPHDVFGQPLGVTGISLASGLEVLHVPRSGTQRLTAGIKSKHSRGDTESARLKQKRLVCVALDNKLACNNVLSILNSADLEKHDLATDCQQWQVGINGFIEVLTENDMLTPFMIPEKFDIDDPTSLSGPFTNILVDFHKVSDESVQLWQQYLRAHAAPVELESDSWAVLIMVKSMTPELKTLVNDDLQDLDKSMTGAVTMFKIVSNHMVLRNQETIDSLHEWLRNFDIRKINGENVSIGSTQCKAVIRALDGFGLPANALRCILDGFAHASNESFKQLCTTLSTMNRSNIMQGMQPNLTVKQKCFMVLKDLESTYIDLSTGHKWDGVGHSNTAFVAQLGDEDSYEAYAMAAREHKIPWDEWVKDVTCHGCGKKGHIKPHCPDRKGRNNDRVHGVGRGRGRGDQDGRGRGRGGQDGRGNGHRSKRDRDERRFKKAYKIALESLADEDTSSGDESAASVSPRANLATAAKDDDKGDDSVDSLAAHAACMYLSLKD